MLAEGEVTGHAHAIEQIEEGCWMAGMIPWYENPLYDEILDCDGVAPGWQRVRMGDVDADYSDKDCVKLMKAWSLWGISAQQQWQWLWEIERAFRQEQV